MKVYVLTSEYNDYNQYGAYFEAVFKEYPTPEQLEKIGCTHLGREGNEYCWFDIDEVELL